MRLISYAATRPGIQGVGSWLVRQGTNSIFSHTEVVFEPGDGVDDMMPDGTTIPTEDGALWCASATVSDIMPEWSDRRAGRKGGVRFKRIVIDEGKWMEQDISDVRNAREVVEFFKSAEGLSYDWRHILGFIGPVLNLMFNHSDRKFTCSEVCAAALGFPEAARIHPGNLPPVIERLTSKVPNEASVAYALRLRNIKNGNKH